MDKLSGESVSAQLQRLLGLLSRRQAPWDPPHAGLSAPEPLPTALAPHACPPSPAAAGQAEEVTAWVRAGLDGPELQVPTWRQEDAVFTADFTPGRDPLSDVSHRSSHPMCVQGTWGWEGGRSLQFAQGTARGP